MRTSAPSEPLTADEVYATLSIGQARRLGGGHGVHLDDGRTLQWLPTTRPGSFFATGSGGIGWGVPGAVGVALGDRERGVKRTHRRHDRRRLVPVLHPGHLDGRSTQAADRVRGAAQRGVRVLKSFALLEKTPNVPALDLPVSTSLRWQRVSAAERPTSTTTDELAREFKVALEADGPTVIVVPTQAELPHLG